MENAERHRDRACRCPARPSVGDAIGTAREFTQRDSLPPLRDMVDGGRFALKAGEWTDDTAMALCLADSVLARRTLDQHDLLQRFCRWWRHGENSYRSVVEHRDHHLRGARALRANRRSDRPQ